MWQEYLSVIAQGIPTSLALMAVALVVGFILAVSLTFTFNGKSPGKMGG